MAQDNGYTYIVWATGTDLYKIGHSHDVPKRLTQLKPGSPHPLEVVVTVNGTHIEKMLHDIFAPYRKHGEWFLFDNELTLLMVKAAAYQLSNHRGHLRAVKNR